MIIVIGKIEDAGGVLEACRVIDSKTKEVKEISFEKIKKAMKEDGTQIKGFKLIDKTDYNSEKLKKSVVKEKTNKFNFNRIPRLNGAGELIDSTEEKQLTLFGWKGFAEMKRYHLFNYKGEEIVLDITELTEKVTAGEINGAVINPRTNKPIISKDLDIEID